MKQDDFKQLEDILTTLDVTLLNRHTYLQNEMVSRILKQNFDFVEIGIFGSYARNEYNALSDVDI